jgi:hypothetical protein
MVKISELLVEPLLSYGPNTDKDCKKGSFFRENRLCSVLLVFLSNGWSVRGAVGFKRKRNKFSTKSFIENYFL